jgi:uncharacterized protein (TIGR02145 family)
MTGIDLRVNLSAETMSIRNFPNPFRGRTAIEIDLPEKDHVNIVVTNLAGQVVTGYSGIFTGGRNTLVFEAGSEHVYLLTATYKSQVRSIKLISSGQHNTSGCRIYCNAGTDPIEKETSAPGAYFDFDPGDQLLFVGHTADEESGILDSPTTNKNYVFQFATNMPCPGLDSLFYENKWYHTIQIMSQCWMKENLDAGTMIMGNQSPSDNGIKEKYCYANNLNNCAAKGGLYIWEELMQYTTNVGAQGMCPEGWHIPTDEELKILEGVADSQYGIGHPVWNGSNTFRGVDAGKNLKSATGWSGNGNGTDLYGFTAVPGGYWWEYGFYENTVSGGCWSSTLSNQSLPWYRGLESTANSIGRFTFDGLVGIAARCLKNQ